MIGVVLCMPLLYFGPELVSGFFHVFRGSGLGFRIELAAVFLAMLGAWLIYDCLRKRPHLQVATQNGCFKLRLLADPDEASLELLRKAAFEGAGIII